MIKACIIQFSLGICGNKEYVSMKSIKDFFHNTNDIMLALIIIVIAAGLIVWRLNVILEYPEKMAQATTSGTQTEIAAGSAFTDSKLTANVSVTITDGGDEAATKDLVGKNLFTSYTQVKKAVKAVGSTSDKLKSGSYDFHKGDTVTEVLDAMLSE